MSPTPLIRSLTKQAAAAAGAPSIARQEARLQLFEPSNLRVRVLDNERDKQGPNLRIHEELRSNIPKNSEEKESGNDQR